MHSPEPADRPSGRPDRARSVERSGIQVHMVAPCSLRIKGASALHALCQLLAMLRGGRTLRLFSGSRLQGQFVHQAALAAGRAGTPLAGAPLPLHARAQSKRGACTRLETRIKEFAAHASLMV